MTKDFNRRYHKNGALEHYSAPIRDDVAAERENREAAELISKAAAFDRLVAWLDSLESVGVAGRFIAPREIREVLEGR